MLFPAGPGDAHCDAHAGAVSEQLGQLETAGGGEEKGKGENRTREEGERAASK